MSDSVKPASREARTLVVVWLLLMALSLATWRLAEAADFAGVGATALVLGIVVVKGHLIAGIFMELVRAHRALALVMSLYLIGLAGGILFFFAIAR